MGHPQKFSKVIPKALIASEDYLLSAAQQKVPQEEESKQNISLDAIKLGQDKPGTEADDGVGFSIFKDLSKLVMTKVERVHKDAITSVNLIYDEEGKIGRAHV